MRRFATAAVVLAALTVPGAAQAATTTAPCWGKDAEMHLRVKPKWCAFNGDEAHAWQTPLRKMQWRSWRSSIACGRGEFFYNMGYHAPARFCLYRPRTMVTGDTVFTRIRGVIGRGCWFGGCDPAGKKPTHFRNDLL